MDLYDRVKKVVNEQIAPILRAEGGSLELVEVSEDGKVLVAMTGSCAVCPMRQFTVKGFVEKVIREQVPEIKEVQIVA
ncbi:MAG: NifU family protein [Candidatus Hecatellaceae archaeon]